MYLAHSLKLLILILCLLLNVAFFTLLERKVLGYIQIRKGPNKLGVKGLLQPFSDAVKLFSKEVNSLNSFNTKMYILSPILSLIIMTMIWLSIPFSQGLMELKLSAVFMLCCLSLSVYPVMGAGWSSNSKYPLLGSVRAVAQTISYEVSLAIVLLSLICYAGSLTLDAFNWSKSYWIFFLAPVLALVWFTTCLAEANRTPFDLSESESELVSGFNTEYSSGGFALFFLAEYGSMLFMSAITAIMLMSAGAPSGGLPLKVIFVVFMFIWVRGTLPRIRYDKLMQLTWKGFLPASLAYLLISFSLMLEI
uniref:NADH-ubiquinone oxidoreductase chain 1 n=1 Tax=Pleurocryptella fimbriata TaxID=2480055 RepID=A0A8K1Y3K2_9CRUS|nr:NADH dehydrogenase subunit 1 [Pleurocryptella fimbriata]